jgi:hypothetical protein
MITMSNLSVSVYIFLPMSPGSDGHSKPNDLRSSGHARPKAFRSGMASRPITLGLAAMPNPRQ